MVGRARSRLTTRRRAVLKHRVCHHRIFACRSRSLQRLRICPCSALATLRSHPGKAGPAGCSISKNPTHQQHPVILNARRSLRSLPCCLSKHICVRTHTPRRPLSTSNRSIAARKMPTSKICSTDSLLGDCAPAETDDRTNLGPESFLAHRPS